MLQDRELDAAGFDRVEAHLRASDPEHRARSPARPTMVSDGTGGVRPLRFDPDGASIGPEVPEELLTRWKNMLAACGRAQARMHRSYERFYKEQEACIGTMHGLLADAGEIAESVRGLADITASALDGDDVPAALAAALRLALDCLRTMADRLEALEVHGDAARERCRI